MRNRSTVTRSLHALVWTLLLAAFTLSSSGCYTMAMAIGVYNNEKERIRETHGDVSVRGRVLYQEASNSQNSTGTFAAIGWRDTVRFQMESEGAGKSTEIVADAGQFNSDFSAHLNNVNRVMIVFIKDGYEPASLSYIVPTERPGNPPGLQINDAVVVMRRERVPTSAPAR